MIMKRVFLSSMLLLVFGLMNHSVQSQKQPGQRRKYNLTQATSDKAQLHTIAFDGLAFMTGNFGADCFFPPGKLADYFGFQYMRDNDENQMGHNTDFLTRIANNVLTILTAEQTNTLIQLAKDQEADYEQFATSRWTLIKAFRTNMEQNRKSDNKKLNESAVLAYSEQLYAIDARLSYHRARAMAAIINQLTDEQKKQFDKLQFNNSATWPELNEPFDKKQLSHRAHVGLMTYASELFSWYKGSLEADIYFCPERHGTYFGGFYLKDFPAMDNHGYNISTSLTGDAGKSFLETLNDAQRTSITNLPAKQKFALNEIVRIRTEICTAFRLFITNPTAAPDENKILLLSKQYGKMEGQLSFYYAMAFAEVFSTLTKNQQQET